MKLLFLLFFWTIASFFLRRYAQKVDSSLFMKYQGMMRVGYSTHPLTRFFKQPLNQVLWFRVTFSFVCVRVSVCFISSLWHFSIILCSTTTEHTTCMVRRQRVFKHCCSRWTFYLCNSVEETPFIRLIILITYKSILTVKILLQGKQSKALNSD